MGRPPLRSRSTIGAKKKRTASKSQESLSAANVAVESAEMRAKTTAEQRADSGSGAQLPSGDQSVDQPGDQSAGLSAPGDVAARERSSSSVEEARRTSDEKRRSSSLFSDVAEPRRSDSSVFSIPAAQPPRAKRSSETSQSSRRSSSLLGPYSGISKQSSTSPSEQGGRKSSSIGSASLFSHGFQSDRRSSSLFSVEMSGDDGEAGAGAPEPAMTRTTAVQQSPTTPATPATPSDDAQNITVVPGKRKPEASPDESKSKGKKFKLYSSPQGPEKGFATPLAPAPAAGRISSEGRTSSSSLGQSASLFSSLEERRSKSSDSSVFVKEKTRESVQEEAEMRGKQIFRQFAWGMVPIDYGLFQWSYVSIA